MSLSLLSLPTFRSTTRTGWLGIDIGTAAVKLAQVRYQNRSWELVSAKTIPVVDKSPAETATAAIESLLEGHSKWLAKPAGCVVTESPDLRSLEVPSEQRSNINGYLKSQSGLVGSGLSTTVWPSTWKSPATENLPCHVYAIHEQTVNSISERLFESGAECRVMESAPHALARLSMFHAEHPNMVCGIIDWSAQHPLFVLTRNGQPYYTRLLRNCSYGQVVQEMSDKLGLSTADVWSLLSGIGSSSCEPADLPSLSNTINELTQTTRHRFLAEVSRTLAFLRSEDSELVPAKLWLVGGGATFPGIAEMIGEETGLLTAAWSLPFKAASDGCRTLNIQHSDFATAISLSALPIFAS